MAAATVPSNGSNPGPNAVSMDIDMDIDLGPEPEFEPDAEPIRTVSCLNALSPKTCLCALLLGYGHTRECH